MTLRSTQTGDAFSGLSRRELLQAAAGLVVSVFVPSGRIEAQAADASASDSFQPDAYVRIALDSSVTVVVKHVELGQGVCTGLVTRIAPAVANASARLRGARPSRLPMAHS